MPNVAGVEYPYTPQGIAAAQQAQAGLDSARMSPPLTSPSHPMAQRQAPDLKEYGGWRSPFQFQDQGKYSQSPSYISSYHGGGAAAQRPVPDLQPHPLWRNSPQAMLGEGDPSYYRTQRPVQDLQPYNPAPIRGKIVGNGVLSSLGYSSQNMPSRQELGNVMQYGHRGVHAPSGRDLYDFSEMRSTPSSPWYQPVAQAPRGQTIQTSGPTNYGQSPSNPNWKPPKP
jgi:hypothetical protein